MPPFSFPFLFENGPVLAIAALFLVALLSVYGLWHRRVRAARLRTHSILAALGPVTPPSNFVDGSSAVLAGRLQVCPAGIEFKGLLSHPDSYNHHPNIALGQGVMLQGSSGFPLLGEAIVLWGQSLSIQETFLEVSIRSGDRIHLRGTLEAIAAREDPGADYRKPAMQWQLRGTAASPLELAAQEAPRPKLAVMEAARAAALGLVFFVGAAHLLGYALFGASESKARVVGEDLQVPLRYQLAVANPLFHGRILEKIKVDLREQGDNLAARRAEVQIELRLGNCADAANLAFESNQWGLASEVAKGCEAAVAGSRLRFHFAMARGDFLQASKALQDAQIISARNNYMLLGMPGFPVGWQDATRVHLLAGNYAAAADTLLHEAQLEADWSDSLSTVPSRSGGMDVDTMVLKPSLDQRVERLRCLAAFAELASNQQAGATPACLENFSFGQRLHTTLETMKDSTAPTANPERVGEPIFRGPNLFNLNTVVARENLPAFPMHYGQLLEAYEALQNRSDKSLARAQLGLELAYWNSLAGRDLVATEQALAARRDFLQNAPANLVSFLSEMRPGELPDNATHWTATSNDSEYFFVIRLQLSDLLLSALATRGGDTAEAKRRLDIATALFPGALSHRMYADSRKLKGKPATDWWKRWQPASSRDGLAGLLQLQERLTKTKAKDWKLEVDAAISSWLGAIEDPHRSRCLTLLDGV